MSKSKKNIIEPYILNNHEGKFLLHLNLPLTLDNSKSYEKLRNNIKLYQGCTNLQLDLSSIGKYDSYLVIFISSLKNFCANSNIKLEFQGLTTEMQSFIEALNRKDAIKAEIKDKGSFWYRYFSKSGDAIIVGLSDFASFISFLGDLTLKIFNLLIHPLKMRWKDFPISLNQSGVNAIPIVLLILFLLGTITGYQGALQLRKFGADIFISYLVGASICRELSPLMVAIIVAGRSGAAYAAEIGTMKVSEEIDALRAMGFDITRFLVMPRVFSVVVAMPILTLLADITGVLGGLVAAINTLNITTFGYFNQLQIDLEFSDVYTGIGKSIVFGYIIATIGCFRGLQVRGGAESVGRYTTASVVTSIFTIIIADAIFTLIFHSLGI